MKKSRNIPLGYQIQSHLHFSQLSTPLRLLCFHRDRRAPRPGRQGVASQSRLSRHHGRVRADMVSHVRQRYRHVQRVHLRPVDGAVQRYTIHQNG